MNFYIGMSIATIVWSIVAFLVGKLIGLSESDLYVFWGAMTALGVAAAGVYTWWRARQQEQAAASSEGGEDSAASGGQDEIDLLIRDAENRLSASKAAHGANLSNLPLIFVIGEQGSVKTSTVLNSGLEAELLAGHVYQENVVAPTRSANVWYAKGTIFVEAAAKLLAEPGRWARIVRRLRPGALRSVVGGKQQAPRGVLLCCDAEIFAKPGNTDQLSTLARNLQARLGDISQTLGISFPVYVLFTRCDRLAFFADYVRNLSNEESGQVLGATLPIRPAHASGVYAEEETQRLTNAFNGLYHSLSDKRLLFLPRETDLTKTPTAYEFPREFRKIRPALVQFLVDVCRPSQLRASPFLRGFYFSGVRPVSVQEMAIPMPPKPQERAYEATSSATGMFSVPSRAPEAAAPAMAQQVTGTKKVPQWVFLTRLFHQIILQDRAALNASGASIKTSGAQRILLGALSLLALLLAIGCTVSYFKNRGLLNHALDAAKAVPVGAPATPESLSKLEELRADLQTLTEYNKDGAPFGFRWALYAGDDAYPHVRCAYYKRFDSMLMAPTFTAMQTSLASKKGSPGPNDDYGATYETLKAYLITGNHPDFRNLSEADKRAAVKPLAAALTQRWAAGRQVDTAMAQKQFDWYANDLVASVPDCMGNKATVETTEDSRKFLSQFSGGDRVYAFMLSEASKANPPVNYNRDVKGSSEAVLNNREIAGAYTKPGWDWMQKALNNIDKYFGGERWVLGSYSGGGVDKALAQQLRDRYTNDFIAQWRNYFKVSTVLRYDNIKDAAKKLNLQSSAASPILALFWLASKNTQVDSPKVMEAFKPVHDVVPPGQGDPVGGSNQAYYSGLGGLYASIEQIANMPGQPDANAAAPTLQNASQAKLAAKQTIKRVDQEAHIETTVQKLLEDPITHVEGLLRGLGPADANAKGAGLCAQLSPVLRKYPFNSAATAEATLAEVNAVFKPGEGSFWQGYEANFKQLVQKQGNQFVPVATPPFPLNPAWVQWLNTVAQFAESLYPGGQGPRLTYTLTPLKSEGFASIVVTIDGQTMNAPGNGGPGKQFTWTGPAMGSKLVGKFGGQDLALPPHEGLWSAWRLFHEAENWTASGPGYNLEWYVKFGNRPMTNQATGLPLAARFHVDNGIFRKGALAGLNCIPKVAR